MKKIYNILTIFGIAFTMAFLSSCEKKYFVAPDEEIKDVSYATDMQPYFDAKCISCHDGGGIPLDLTSPGSYSNLINSSKNYVDTDNPEASIIYTKVLPGESMAEHASPTERTMTLVWIQEGANDN